MRRALAIALLSLCAASSDAGSMRLRQHYYRAPWTPEQLGATVLVADWSADDYAKMVDDGSGLISSWKDRRTQLAVTATTTARGTWARNSFNSIYPGITFDGVANTYVTTTLTALPTGSTAGEIWVLASASTSGTAGVTLAYGTGGATSRQARKNPSNFASMSDGTTVTSDATSSYLGNHLMMAEFSGTTENGWMDGVAFSGNPGTAANLATGTTRLRIGASQTGSPAMFFLGVISRVLIVTGALSASDRQKMEGYLLWSKGLQANLAVSHPYRWAPP